MIEAIGLAKFYGDFAAIEDVSFTVPKGRSWPFWAPTAPARARR